MEKLKVMRLAFGATPTLVRRPFPGLRLLSGLIIGWLVLSSFRRERLARLAVLVGGFLVSLIPLVVFQLRSPGALFARVKEVSYLSDEHLTATEKFWSFVESHFEYFTMRFLYLHGDANLRPRADTGAWSSARSSCSWRWACCSGSASSCGSRSVDSCAASSRSLQWRPR